MEILAYYLATLNQLSNTFPQQITVCCYSNAVDSELPSTKVE